MPRTALFATLLLTACATDLPRPRGRLGSVPHPGALSGYAIAEPGELGEHRYSACLFGVLSPERQRGLVYTRDAGMLDLAHVRMAADWARYGAVRAEACLRTGRSSFDFDGRDRSRFEVALHPPAVLDELPDDERDALLRELSIRIGQEVGYARATWHEILSWIGHRAGYVFPMTPSAFTYEDPMSHLVGVRVAGAAMRDGTAPYDAALTRALDEELARLGALTGDETIATCEAVEGIWWEGGLLGSVLKRNLDVGLDTRVVPPWLVPRALDPDGAWAPSGTAHSFSLPDFADVLGHDCRGAFMLTIDPDHLAATRLARRLDGDPLRFRWDTHGPALVATIREEIAAAEGEDALAP